MSAKRLLMIALAGAGLGLLASTLVATVLGNNLSVITCTPAQTVAVGGCDGDGVCGVVAVTQDGQVIKGKAAYPIAGLVDCRESIDE
jgi:hypothetical protein